MLWIAVTPPAFHDGEAAFISRLLAGGVDVVHLRKPGSAEAECAGLLEALSEDERARVVVHDHFGLAARYGLMGIHLNSRNPSVPEGFCGHVSRSCHSLEEVRRFKPECGYVFLSPVFDSISKQGYASVFSEEDLHRAAASGIIDSRVVALGGVTPERLPYLRSLGFGGAAMLGCVSSIASLPEERQAAAIEAIRRAVKSE